MQRYRLMSIVGSVCCPWLLLVGIASAQPGNDRVVPPNAIPVPSFPLPSDNEARIERALKAPTSVKWVEKSLDAAFEELEVQHKIDIWIDVAALAEAGVNRDEVITLNLKQISLTSCLKLILEPLGLVSVVEDEVLKITTPEKLAKRTITRIYPVGDLCTSPEEALELLETLECGIGQPREQAGVNRMVISSQLKTLTVRDSYAIQQEVKTMLLALREAQPTEKQGKVLAKPLEVNLTFAYLRDQEGRRTSETPVVFCNEDYMEVENLTSTLEREKRFLMAIHGQDVVGKVAVLIRVDRQVPMGLIKQLVTKCQESGFVNVSLRATAEEK